MSWESGPALPPGTLVLTAEQAATLTASLAALGHAFAEFGRALAEARLTGLTEGLVDLDALADRAPPPLRVVESHLRPKD